MVYEESTWAQFGGLEGDITEPYCTLLCNCTLLHTLVQLHTLPSTGGDQLPPLTLKTSEKKTFFAHIEMLVVTIENLNS